MRRTFGAPSVTEFAILSLILAVAAIVGMHFLSNLIGL
jgi:hypothetical protein